MAVGHLCCEVGFGIVGHEATRVGVAVIGLTGVRHVVGSNGPVGVAFLDLLLVGVDGTEATTGLLVPHTWNTQGATEEVKNFLTTLGVGRSLVAHHLSVPGQRTDLDLEVAAQGEAVVQAINLNNVAAGGCRVELVQSNTVAVPDGSIALVTSAQAGEQQILAGEGGLQAQTQVIGEGEGTVFSVVRIALAALGIG